MTEFTPEYIAQRNAAMAKYDGWIGHDALDPTGPSGHAYGLAVSTRLTTYYREARCEGSVDVKPQEVIDCLVEAGVKKYCLMGLHGYVGYLPMPRATQDVDIMVPYSQKNKAAKAVGIRWPMLQRTDLSQVVRFMDPADRDENGRAKPVIDIMLPWSKFQETILKEFVLVDKKSKNRIPTVEAAIVSKYAALVSPHRDWEKREYDAGDLRRIIKANFQKLDKQVLERLASEVWERGGKEILQFLELVQENKPFPI